MNRQDAAAYVNYHQLLRDLNAVSVASIRVPGDDRAGDAEAAVRAITEYNHSRIIDAWLNARHALRQAGVEVEDPDTNLVDVPPPTSEDLAQALDFGPAMDAIRQHLPVVKPRFVGFSNMRTGSVKTVVIAAVIGLIAALTQPSSPYDEVHRPEYGPFLLLVCLGLAARDWFRDYRPIALREQWMRTDARYIGSICYSIFVPTVTVWLVLTFMS